MCLVCQGNSPLQNEEPAGQAAAIALNDPTVVHGPVTVMNQELPIQAYLARPAGGAALPAIIITHGNAGLPEDMRNAAAQVAQAGFIGLLLDPTSRTPDYRTLSREYLMSYRYIKALLSDIEAAIAYLRARPDVRSDRIGLLGFCGGGILNIMFAATHPGIRAVVAFYAAPRTPPEANSAHDPRPDMIAFVPRLTASLQYHVGTEDIYIPSHDLAEFEAALQSYQVSAEIYRYPGAVHGFYHYTYPDEYHPQAAAQAHLRMCAFFQHHLSSNKL